MAAPLASFPPEAAMHVNEAREFRPHDRRRCHRRWYVWCFIINAVNLLAVIGSLLVLEADQLNLSARLTSAGRSKMALGMRPGYQRSSARC